MYVAAKEMTKKPDATKITMLLSAVGPDALAWSDTATSNSKKVKTNEKYDHVKIKFETELAGQKRFVLSRYQFWDYSKTSGQTFDEFLTQLRTLSLPCEFADPDNMIGDKIVFSTENPALKEWLLREPKLDLQKDV